MQIRCCLKFKQLPHPPNFFSERTNMKTDEDAGAQAQAFINRLRLPRAAKSEGVVTNKSTPVPMQVAPQAPASTTPPRRTEVVVFPPNQKPATVPFFSGNTGGGRGGKRGGGSGGNNQPKSANMNMNSGKYFIVGILALVGGLGNILVAIYSSYLPTTREGYAENTQRRAAYIITEANSSYERCLQLWKKQGSGLSISIPSTTGAGPAIGVSEPQVTLPNCSAALRDQLNAATAIINNR